MNKSELIDEVHSELLNWVSKDKIEIVLNMLCTVITDQVATGNSVDIRGFGRFKAADRAARVSYNPATGGTIDLPAKRVPTFKAGKAFKEKLSTE
jgi:nucleoid DNA-binding protein